MTKDKGLVIKLKISPKSSMNEIIKTSEGVKVKITAQPVGGKANKCLIEFLAKTFKIPKTSIEILKGETSKEKTLLIKILDDDKISMIKNVLE